MYIVRVYCTQAKNSRHKRNTTPFAVVSEVSCDALNSIVQPQVLSKIVQTYLSMLAEHLTHTRYCDKPTYTMGVRLSGHTCAPAMNEHEKVIPTSHRKLFT